MELSDLFNGIAVVIDDEINDPKANINNVLQQLESKDIPCLKYDGLPESCSLRHFHSLAFVLLDWRLIKQDINDELIEDGVTVPAHLQRYEASENISFIKDIKNKCFCPIFIFTNENKDDIVQQLCENDLYDENKPSNIFVKSKSDIKGKNKVFKEIEKWISSNPSIYVLKEWENEYHKTKTKLFLDFQNISPVWPKVMWKNFEDDNVNKSLCLGENIFRNLKSRMAPFDFNGTILSKRGKCIDSLELRSVLEGERFLKNENLHADNIAPGDIFKIRRNFYINIRPACDLVARDRSQDAIDLYLLKGSKLSSKNLKKTFTKSHGIFNENDGQSIVFPVCDGKGFDFRFKNITLEKWVDIKNKRVGRLLPPYVTRIQQKYALYAQRQGLPRTPWAAIIDSQEQ